MYPEAQQSASHSLRVSLHLSFSRCIVSCSRQVQSSCEYGVNFVPVSRGRAQRVGLNYEDYNLSSQMLYLFGWNLQLLNKSRL